LNTEPPSEAARATEEIYLEMLGAENRTAPPEPYNLLLTRDWMLYVPRRLEKYGSISVNALGFAGSLLARDEGELEVIRNRGPLAILADVGVRPAEFGRDSK
jgi:ATP adenylyltransferase